MYKLNSLYYFIVILFLLSLFFLSARKSQIFTSPMQLEETYNEYLLDKLAQLFPKKELQSYLEANEKDRPTVLRINTLLKRRKDVLFYLSNRKVDCDVLDWNDDLIIAYKSEVPLGATPEYLAGYYIIQGASSILPVINLEIKKNQRIVDLCAAPGGKSTHIGAIMNNTGILYCNDICKERINSLRSNLMRMGITNAIITNKNANEFDIGKVDRVLLDAPCSGTGIISKDKSVKTSKTADEIKKIVKEQKKLIKHAYDMLKGDGVLVYSTCSILVDENEKVVDYLLRERAGAKIEEMEVAVGRNGFTNFRGESYHGSMSKARRIYPHVHNMDGFFYCKIRRTQ